MLTFVSGKLDVTFGGLTVPLTRDITNQSPQAICELNPTNVSRNLIINPDAAPFDNSELRRAMALSLDRKAFIDIITEGKGNTGGVMLPPPARPRSERGAGAGHAGRGLALSTRLWPRCDTEPQGSAVNYAAARLRPR